MPTGPIMKWFHKKKKKIAEKGGENADKEEGAGKGAAELGREKC